MRLLASKSDRWKYNVSYNILKNLLMLLIRENKIDSFTSTLPGDDLFSYSSLYTQLSLKSVPAGSKNTQTIFEFRYENHTQLEQLLQSTTANILIFWSPVTEIQKERYPAIMHSLWQLLERHGFQHILCYYPNTQDITLGLTEKCLENIPLLIVIQNDLFVKVQYDLLNFFYHQQKYHLKNQPLVEDQEVDSKLLNFCLDRYKILQLPIYSALNKIENYLSTDHTEQIKQELITIKQKTDELAYFFRLSIYKKYTALCYVAPHSVWQNRLANKLIRFLFRCKNLFSPKLGQLYHYPPKPLLYKNTAPSVLKKADIPRISIVTPSFNQGSYIERTIKSILDQNYPNLEYVIQDGLSSDNTVEIIQKYHTQLTHWESIQDNGQSHAINLGFAHCSGEIMAYLNSDDLLLPGSLNYIANYFMQHPEVDVVYGHRILIDENDLEIGRWILPSHSNAILSWADYIPQETLFWRRSLWEKVGGIDESFKFAMDWDLILRFRDAGAKFKRLPKFMGAFRVHAAQKTSAAIDGTGIQEMARLRYRCLQYNPSHPKIHKHISIYLLRHLFYHNLYAMRIAHYD